MIAFIDDIVVYLRIREEYMQYFRIVLLPWGDHFLYDKLSKYEFWFELVTLLGHVASKAGFIVDLLTLSDS